MIKKLAAYCFILVANIILLVHAVLPHHHHNQHVCFGINHCNCIEATDTYNAQVNHHQHGGKANSTGCLLKNEIVVPSSQDKLLKNCYNCSETLNYDYYTFTNPGHVHIQTVNDWVPCLPGYSPLISLYINADSALRAPPIV